MTADIAIGSPQEVTDYDDLLPGNLRLLGNFPNPFNPATSIMFEVIEESMVKLEIYNIMGQKIATLNDSRVPQGIYSINWDGKDNYGNETGSGIYFFRISSKDRSVSSKMMKIR